MRYAVALQSARYIAPSRRFAVYNAREIIEADKLGGWAVLVFRDRIPEDSLTQLFVWADWLHNEDFGVQLAVRTWIPYTDDGDLLDSGAEQARD